MRKRVYDVLKKFENGDYVNRDNEGEGRILDEYASIGFVYLGISTQDGRTRETASLTKLGHAELELEEYSRMPPSMKQFFNLVNHSLYALFG